MDIKIPEMITIDFPAMLDKIKEKMKYYRFTVLDRYILTVFVSSFIVSLFFFISIYILTQIFTELRWLPPGTDVFLIFQYYFFYGVYWTCILQPFSFLFATVYVLSRMAQFKELTAIVSTGTSIYRISFYPLLFTVIYCLFMILYFQNAIIFPANQKKNILNQIIFHKVDQKALVSLKDNQNFSVFGSNNLIYIVGYYHAVSSEMENITIIRLKNDNNDRKAEEYISNQNMWLITNAEELTKKRNLVYPENVNISLRIDANKAIWDLNARKWIFEHGIIRTIENAGESFIVRAFTNETFDFISDPPYYFERVWYAIDAMTYEEGARYIEKLVKSKQDYKEQKARYLSNFTYPLGIIFVVLAGIGIVDMSRRKYSFIINLMLSMALFVVYYLFFSIGISLAGKGNITPEMGALMGTVFLAITSIYIFKKAKT